MAQDNNTTTKMPQDPTTNTNSFVADATGKPGVTHDHSPQPSVDPDQPGISKIMSDVAYKNADELSSLKDTDPDDIHIRGEIPNTDLDNNSATSPAIDDEQSMSGSASDPDSDDDTLAAAQTVGLHLSEDVEHPQELNIAGDIDAAEEYHKTH